MNEINKEDLKRLVEPFWLQDVMYNESICMIVREDGTVNSRTMFVPEEIISVKDVYLQKEYTEGVDYKWERGTNVITWLPGSAIPFFTQNDIHGKNEAGEYIEQYPAMDELQRSRFGDALYCIEAFLYEKQISITYRYNKNDYKGIIPEYQPERLVNVLSKLEKEKKLKAVFFGDSIFTGLDSSGKHEREPYLPALSDLVKITIEKYFDAEVDMHMTAVSGMDSVWGANTCMENCADIEPDLVVVSFGMNDGDRDPKEVRANMQKIIDSTLSKNPNCNFIVIGCMVANSDGGFLKKQKEYAIEFSQIPDVAFASVFDMHSEILKTKDFIATSGNNINHPNDWLSRIYAMNILSCMIDWDK